MKKFLYATLITLLATLTLQAYEVTPSNFDKAIHSKRVVLVKFYANWCAPCHILKPEFDKAKQEVGDKALFVEYNVDNGKDILRKYGVTHLPTMILFENGKAVDGVESVVDAQNIKEWVLGYVPQTIK